MPPFFDFGPLEEESGDGLVEGKCPKSEVIGIYRLTYRRFLSILKIINP